MNYDDLLKTDGEGRHVLEERLALAVRELKTLHINLTSVQTRCTELLESQRALVAASFPLETVKDVADDGYVRLADRLAYGMREWDSATRMAFLACLTDLFCVRCGDDLDGRVCHCTLSLPRGVPAKDSQRPETD